jgi:hypothetical protein
MKRSRSSRTLIRLQVARLRPRGLSRLGSLEGMGVGEGTVCRASQASAKRAIPHTAVVRERAAIQGDHGTENGAIGQRAGVVEDSRKRRRAVGEQDSLVGGVEPYGRVSSDKAMRSGRSTMGFRSDRLRQSARQLR